MSILVVGTVAFDSVETPFGNRDRVLGGSASYLATSASFYGPSRIVSVIGEDFPDEHLQRFRGRGIDTTGIERVKGGKTFYWRGRYDENLNVAHTLDTQLNVLADFNPQVPAAYRDAKFVALGNFAPELQLQVLKQLDGPKLVAADTMNFWIEGSNSALRETLKHVDLLSINDGEARLLSNEYNLRHAARVIREMGPKILVIKRGEYGALLFVGEEIFSAPAYPLEVIRDPTGAGDTFAGGMLGFLAKQDRIDEACLRQSIIVGSAMASFVVEDFSLDRMASLDRETIEMRFREFNHLTHFDQHGLMVGDR